MLAPKDSTFPFHKLGVRGSGGVGPPHLRVRAQLLPSQEPGEPTVGSAEAEAAHS